MGFQAGIVILMAAGRLAVGSEKLARGLDAGVATTTSATGATSHRLVAAPGPRTGGRSRCRSARSRRVVGDAGRVRCARRPPGRRRPAWQGHPAGPGAGSSGPGARPARTAPWWLGRTPRPSSGTRPPAPGLPGTWPPGRRSGRRPAPRSPGCGAHQQPAAPAGRCAVGGKRHPRPGIPAFALGAIGGVDPQPALRRDSRGQALAAIGGPERDGRDSVHLTASTCGSPWVSTRRAGGVDAVDLIGGHPGGRHSGGKRALQHPAGQLGLGGEGDVFRHPGGLAAVGVISPAAGHVQLPVNDRVPVPAGIGQVDRDLGVVDLAAGAGVLTLHPTVWVPFLQCPSRRAPAPRAGRRGGRGRSPECRHGPYRRPKPPR